MQLAAYSVLSWPSSCCSATVTRPRTPRACSPAGPRASASPTPAGSRPPGSRSGSRRSPSPGPSPARSSGAPRRPPSPWPGHDVVADDRLGECHYGAWTGRPLAEAAKEDLWRVVQDDPGAATFPPHDRFAAESLAEMADRVIGGVRAARRRGRGRARRGCRVGRREPRRPDQGRRRRGRRAPGSRACSGCASTPGRSPPSTSRPPGWCCSRATRVEGDLAPARGPSAARPGGRLGGRRRGRLIARGACCE